MPKFIISLTLLFFVHFLSGQLVINELDCDSPSIDDKEFIELRSESPNFNMDGFIIVFFNGSSSGGNTSYLKIDLNGYATDINGIFLIGSKTVSPSPQFLIPANMIQNGADGVGIYQSDTINFPDGTLATDVNLIDALVYDTNDSDVTSMMELLGVSEQINEGMNGKKDTESIQRNNDGSYFVGPPTPRQLNDGSGVVLNGINIVLNDVQFMEGESFDIVLEMELPAEEDLNFELSLENGTFDADDFSGEVSLEITEGEFSVSTTIFLEDDDEDEGDEVLMISLDDVPDGFFTFNNDVEVRVVDNDYQVAPWGIPTDPSFGLVESSQTADYYENLDGQSGPDLIQELQDIIADPNIVRVHTYADIVEMLNSADQNPANSNQVWLVYTETGRAKLDYQYTSDNNGKWNREHTFPRSRGGFHSIEGDNIADGIDLYWETNADSLRHGNSDGHGLRAADGSENSSRGNQHYGEYNGPPANMGSFKGDVARSVFYMAIRYNGLQIVNGFPDITGQLGDLETLLEWHRQDPPDDFEMNRNNVIQEWQHNRNPFIDLPELVEYIWGIHQNEEWSDQVGANESDASEDPIFIYPNPAKDHIFIEGTDLVSATLLTFDGQSQKSFLAQENGKIKVDFNHPNGIYILKIKTNDQIIFRKFLVE